MSLHILYIINFRPTSSSIINRGFWIIGYLEAAIKNLDYSQVHLVFEALHERTTFLHIAPHLTRKLPLLTPCYKYGEIDSTDSYIYWITILGGTIFHICTLVWPCTIYSPEKESSESTYQQRSRRKIRILVSRGILPSAPRFCQKQSHWKDSRN